jgi:hypothetical protein
MADNPQQMFPSGSSPRASDFDFDSVQEIMLYKVLACFFLLILHFTYIVCLYFSKDVPKGKQPASNPSNTASRSTKNPENDE